MRLLSLKKWFISCNHVIFHVFLSTTAAKRRRHKFKAKAAHKALYSHLAPILKDFVWTLGPIHIPCFLICPDLKIITQTYFPTDPDFYQHILSHFIKLLEASTNPLGNKGQKGTTNLTWALVIFSCS